jgi:hypothetical protein
MTPVPPQHPQDVPGPQRPPYEQVVADVVMDACRAHRDGDSTRFAAAIAVLLEPFGGGEWAPVVERSVSTFLRTAITGAWGRGWQPADLLRLGRRRFTELHVRLLTDAIAAELQTYATTTIDPRWLAQLGEAGARTWWPADQSFLHARSTQAHHEWPAVLSAAVQVLCMLWDLPVVEHLTPLPGAAPTASTPRPAPDVDAHVLDRIRLLLAKAEATTSPEEAEALTAAAQERMTRYRIDQAMLASTEPGPSTTPSGRRIGIESPYEAAKAVLLDAIARANRCRAVWARGLGFTTVIGFGPDLDVVETLFTSLRVQAVTAMSHAGTAERTRTRSFRHAFLTGYAHRIGERLSDVAQAQTQAASTETGGSALLPVLVSRDNAVEDALKTMFPALTSVSPGTTIDPAGWYSGRGAAETAALQIGKSLPDKS